MLNLSDHDALTLTWYTQSKPLFMGGHEVHLLRGACAMFPALIESIDNAQRSIWVATYLVSEHGEATHVIDALCRAAQRGIEVHMVVDGVGSEDVDPQVWEMVRRSGVKLEVFRPLGPWWKVVFDSTLWRRMHIKLCVIDETIAYTGGINMIDDRYDLDHGWCESPRLDYAVRFTGPSVQVALQTARALWTRASLGRDWRDDIVEMLRDPRRLQRVRQLWESSRLSMSRKARTAVEATADHVHPIQAAFVLRDNLRQRRTIERAAIAAIVGATTSVDIVTPYFYPGRALKRSLKAAARRGVKVRLLLQGRPDYLMAATAARVLYRELQKHGVLIYEYQAALLHAKVLCIDNRWATVGSSNLDPLSLVMNLEANLIVEDAAFANTLAAELAIDFSKSKAIGNDEDLHNAWYHPITRVLIAAVAKLYLRLAGIVRQY